jgi:transposase
MKTFDLKAEDRSSLKELLQKGVHSTRKLTRARILLRLGEGIKAVQVASELSVSSGTVYNVLHKYNSGGLKHALEDQPRPGRPTIFDGHDHAQITILACSDAPKGRAKWSLRLLADKAVELNLVEHISIDSVRRILKKTT